MSQDRRPLDQEIESLSRMVRESSDFYEGLAASLRLLESQEPSDTPQAAKSVGQE